MGTKYQGTSQEIRALNAFIKLTRSVESVNGRLGEHLNKGGLTISQFGILDALYHLGPLCQRELATKILKSGGNITKVVDNLEKNNLVQRERNSNDRRYFTINLTAKGKELISRVLPEQVNLVVKEMGVLSNLELEVLGRLCKRIGLELESDEE